MNLTDLSIEKVAAGVLQPLFHVQNCAYSAWSAQTMEVILHCRKQRIDEPATEVVRNTFALCLGGLGPLQIAKQPEREQVLTPTAYYSSIGRGTRNPMPANPYRWASPTVEIILANRQYTVCAVNFKTTTASYKVRKTVYKPAEDWQIIPNMQDPIIDDNTWLRVQELRQKRFFERSAPLMLFRGTAGYAQP